MVDTVVVFLFAFVFHAFAFGTRVYRFRRTIVGANFHTGDNSFEARQRRADGIDGSWQEKREIYNIFDGFEW